MTSVGINYVTLEDVVVHSDVIVEAVKADSFTTQQEIKIHRNTGKYPPYTKSLYHFRITGVIYSADTALCKDREITVEDAYAGSDLELHKMYYLKGIGRSPIHDRYRSKVDIDDIKNEKVILFLRKTGEGSNFKYTVDFSYEENSRKPEIVRLIGKIKK